MVLRKFLFSILLLTGIIGNLSQVVASGSNQFILNKGQVHFTDGSKAEKVLCTFGFPSGYAHFLREGVDYYFVKIDENDSLNRKVEKVSLRYEHINEPSRFEAGERSGYEEHYYQGGRTETAVHTEGVNDFWIRDIYAGIDLHYYLKDGALKYDFIVAAGARIDQIKWKYYGKIRSSIQNDAIHIQGQWGKLSESKPFSFLLPEKREVDIRYKEDGFFSFGSQNKTYEQELVIDPAIIWATFYGGNDHDAPLSLNYHSDGGFYLTGFTRSTNNIAYNGYLNTYPGNWCMFIAKFDSLDTREWGSYYYGGTSGGGVGYYEPSGSIYICFSTKDTGLATRGTKQPNQFDYDALLIKVNLNGYPIWSKYFGGDSSDSWSHIHSNNPKELVLFGSTSSTTSAVNSFGAQSTFYSNPFISKLDSSGNLIWSRLITGNEKTNVNDVKVLSSGKILALAYTLADNLATSGAYRTNRTNNGSSVSDGIIMMLNADGTMNWASYCGSNGKESGLHAEIGGSGEIYLTFSSDGYGAEYPPNSSSYNGGQYGDIVLSKWDTSGQPIWSKYYGSTQAEGIGDFKLISDTKMVLVGSGMPPGFISNGVFQDTVHWISDGLILVMDTSGQILWGSYYGLSQNEVARYVDYKNNNFIVAGETTGSPFFQNKSNHQPSYGGGYQDVYIMHILENRLLLDLNLNTNYCPGSTMKVAFNILDSVGYNNSVIIQIGNQNGTSYSLLGSKFSNQIGRDSVVITIPTSLGAGEYPLRYILNSPPDTIYPDQKIKILDAPNAGFTSSFKPYYCEHDTVVLVSDNPSNYSFAWYKDGVLLNANSDSLLVVDTSGTYKVIVTGTNGCKRVSSNKDIRFEYPRAALSWNLDSQQCNNAVSINVLDNSDTNSIYSRAWIWNGIVDDTSMNYTRSTADTGISELMLRIETQNGCVDSVGIHFTVFPKPVLLWTISDSSFCLNDQSLNIQRNEDTSWQFAEINFGDSTVTHAVSAVHSYPAAGVYIMSYTVIDQYACTDTINSNISVYPVPQAKFATSDSLLCDRRSPFQLVDQSLGANQYHWDLGDSTTSQAQSPTKAYQPGTYLVTLVAFNANNCSDTFTQPITIHQTETAQITPLSAQFCIGDSIQVQVNCSNTQGLIWMMNGQQYDTACLIWVRDSVERTLIRRGSNYCPDTLQVKYSLFPEITLPGIQRTGDTLRCIGSYSSYQWYKDGQLLNSANGPEYIFTQNGSYHLVVSDSNGCNASSSSLSIQNVGFESVEEDVIRVYPNPASNSLDMDWETSVEEIQALQIYTALGQVVYQATELKGKHLQVDVSNWKNGIYSLSLVTDSGNVYSRLIIIQH